jgi:hypothetical protein
MSSVKNFVSGARKRRRENAPFRNFFYFIFLEMTNLESIKLKDMTHAQLVLLLKFYGLEENIDTVPKMRRFFGRYLEQQGFPCRGRNLLNLMNPITRNVINEGWTTEEQKKIIKKIQLHYTT